MFLGKDADYVSPAAGAGALVCYRCPNITVEVTEYELQKAQAEALMMAGFAPGFAGIGGGPAK